ncbi:MAG: hypothetical protein PHU80_11380 [Kiritimatiellae bacterium]|nr:hypothetical protein [Kiritimatiellia bacterium]
MRGRLLLAAPGEYKNYRIGPVGKSEGFVDFTFRAADAACGDAFIRVNFGNQTGSVILDDVCLTEADGEEPVLGPYTFEGGLDEFRRDWDVLNTEKMGDALKIEVTKGEWKSEALKVTLTPVAGQKLPELVLHSRAKVSLRKGIFYRFSVRIHADYERRISLDIGCGDAPFRSIMESAPPFSAQVRLAAQAGVNLGTTYSSMPWIQAQTSLNASVFFDTATDRLLEVNPQAVIFPRFSMEPGRWWRESNPGDTMAWEEGDKLVDPMTRLYGGAGSSMPDPASEKYRKEAGEHLAAYVHAMESRYGPNIGGYHPCGQTVGEWFYYGTYGKYHGYSVASRLAWRKWLKLKYGTDDVLADRWNHPGARCATAEPPAPKRRYKPGLGMLYDPETQQDIIDFNQFQQEMLADTIIYFARIIRNETRGQKLVIVFYGYSYEFAQLRHGPAITGHYALRRVLQSPDIDGIVSPISYGDRQSGGSGAPQVPVESIALAGKVFFSEDDTDTHLSTKKAAGLRAKSLEESNHLLRRNNAQAALRNYAAWWMDLRSRGWFADPGVWDEMRRLEKVDRVMLDHPKPFEPGIAAFVDEYSMLAVGFNGDRLTRPLVYEGRASLGRVGTPFGQYLLDDFTSGKIGKAKLLVFLNAWNLDAVQRAAILRYSAGKTRFWCHAAGLIDGRRASVGNMTALTGFTYKRLPELKEKESARVKATSMGLALGLPQEWKCAPADPLFAVVDVKAAETLATWPDGSTAVVMRRGADGVDIFCGIPYVPTALYRAAARVAGVHLFTEEEECNVCANGPFLSLHASRDGNVVVRLPREVEIFDALSEKKLGDRHTLTLPMKKGETRVLRLDR